MGALVPCDTGCTLTDLAVLIKNVYDFLVTMIALPLAGLMIVLGGIILLISGGNPGLASTGKKMIYGTIIAILLVLGSWLIINAVLLAIGYVGGGL